MLNLRNTVIILLLGLLLTSFGLGQVVMVEPKADMISPINRISVTAAGKSGALVDLYVNDVFVRDDTVRIDGLLDFLNVDVPLGPVSIKVSTTNKKGRVFSAARDIHVLGPVNKIISLETEMNIPADGVTEKNIRLEIQDPWGFRIGNIRVATVKMSAGTILNEDLDPEMVGTQVKVNDGYIDLNIQAASDAAGLNIIEVQAMGFAGQIPLNYDLPMIPFIFVGGLDVAAATQGSDQEPLDIPDFGILNNNRIKLGSSAMTGGRAAFYTTGSVKPGLNLTASFDTDRGYMDQLFYDVDPNAQYPLLGDASTIVYDAQTRSKLYSKLAYGKSFALIGDYNTNLSNTEFAAYNRTFNGFQSELYYGAHKLSLFGTLSDRTMLQEEIRGEGISGYYRLNKTNITRFSEKIQIITRDRYHPEKILKKQILSRFQDYDINYVDGTLMFKQPVPSIDAESNAVFILVSYEYEGSDVNLLIGGARYEGEIESGFQLIPAIELGTTIIAEEQATNNYVLMGVDAGLPIGDKIKLETELAHTSSPDAAGNSRSGLAYRLNLEAQPIPALGVEAYIRQVDSGFVNTSQIGRSNEQGSRKFGLSGDYRSVRWGTVNSEYYHQQMEQSSTLRTTNQVYTLSLERPISKDAQMKLGYEFAQRDQSFLLQDSSFTSTSNLLRGSYRVKVLEKVNVIMDHQQNLSVKDRSKPTSSSVGLSYPVTEKLEVFWKYRFIQGEGVNRQSVLGFNSLIGEDTRLEAKYEIDGINGEARNRASIALNNRWEVRDYLILNASIENVSTIDSLELPSPTHQAMSLSAEFLPDMPLKGIGKFEVRDDPSSVQRVITLGGDMKIFSGFGALAKLDHHEKRFKAEDAGSITRENYQFGVAYRPETNDRVNALGKMAYISDRNSHITPISRQDRLIFSSHTYWQIRPLMGLGARIAHRMVLDEEGDLFSDRTNTFFGSLRGEIGWNLEWSSIIDMRYIYLAPLSESAFGLAAEMDYLVAKNTQVGLGYIFKNFRDPDFALFEHQYNNIYVSLHMKFSEDIFNWR